MIKINYIESKFKFYSFHSVCYFNILRSFSTSWVSDRPLMYKSYYFEPDSRFDLKMNQNGEQFSKYINDQY